MRHFILLVCSVIAIGWTLSVHAGDLDDTKLASFLPAPQPGYTADVEAVASNKPETGHWAGSLYRGETTFVLTIAQDTPATANQLALIENLQSVEASSEKVDIAGVEFVVIAGECMAALPGDVVVACTSFSDDVASHLETIDFEALSAAALK